MEYPETVKVVPCLPLELVIAILELVIDEEPGKAKEFTLLSRQIQPL